jgi:hypothetical protein
MDDEHSPSALLAVYPDPIREAAERLRAIVRRAIPDAIEAVRPGWRLIGYRVPAGKRSAYFGFIAPEPIHVHLGFEYGMLIDDPEAVLGGTELKQVRFFTFRSPDEIDEELAIGFVRQAARIAALGRAERVALAFDREERGRPVA